MAAVTGGPGAGARRLKYDKAASRARAAPPQARTLACETWSRLALEGAEEQGR
eukprot:gene7715-10174_t